VTADELKSFLAKHALWIAGDATGERADLTGASLARAEAAKLREELDALYANPKQHNINECTTFRAMCEMRAELEKLRGKK
jgi:hypothetical protein